MRKHVLPLGALALLVGAQAGAAVLPVTATYSLLFTNQVPPVSFSASGIGSSNGFGGSSAIPANLFAGNAALVVPVVPTFVGLTNVTIPANTLNNTAATFTPGGAMGLAGSAFFNSGSGGSVPLFPFGGNATGMSFIQGIPIQAVGGAWQYDAAKIFTAMGVALSNAMSVTATAYDNRTASGIGTLQLVAAGYTLVGNGGSLGNLPVLATLQLTFTPEPGTLLLLGTGITALAAIGRKRTGEL
jgi:hypothetical protein